MVFTTTNLFKGIACPEGESCRLTNCIFNHELRPQQQAPPAHPPVKSTAPESKPASPFAKEEEPAHKRRKVTYESLADKPPSRADQIRSQLAAVRSGNHRTAQNTPEAKPAANPGLRAPTTLTRTVSPPSRNSVAVLSQSKQSAGSADFKKSVEAPSKQVSKAPAVKAETLNPRLVPTAPESHAKRTVLIKLLHTGMAQLNTQLLSSTTSIAGLDPERLKFLVLDDIELSKMALDEEEKIAREQPKIYANVIKNRIAAYKKMTPEVWIEQVKTSFRKDTAPKAVKETQEKPIVTGLRLEEEALILPYLVVSDQRALSRHGYVAEPPSEAEATEAAAAVLASKNYESCDRCSARFQVFPDRDESGQLTTQGPCKHHPMRKIIPTKAKTDAYTGGKEAYYPCCGQVVGSIGCTENEDHVFKASSPARLAAVLPFATTPENDAPSKDAKGRVVKAVCFDCEMGYTALGMELIRLTACRWPDGDPLIDVLVRPLGTIIDLNSRFSGVWPEHFTSAIPYDQYVASPPRIKPGTDTVTPLPIVDSPSAARSLLCSYLTPTTPLLGHAIDNDLNVTRLCHPTIVDTVILFAHPRGLPMRFGLKMLTKKYINREIQMGGARGHDSLEDAQATGDLVRVKVAEKWKEMMRDGWKVEGGVLISPAGKISLNGDGAGRKRKKSTEEDGTAGTRTLASILKENAAVPESDQLTTEFLEK